MRNVCHAICLDALINYILLYIHLLVLAMHLINCWDCTQWFIDRWIFCYYKTIKIYETWKLVLGCRWLPEAWSIHKNIKHVEYKFHEMQQCVALLYTNQLVYLHSALHLATLYRNYFSQCMIVRYAANKSKGTYTSFWQLCKFPLLVMYSAQ